MRIGSCFMFTGGVINFLFLLLEFGFTIVKCNFLAISLFSHIIESFKYSSSFFPFSLSLYESSMDTSLVAGAEFVQRLNMGNIYYFRRRAVGIVKGFVWMFRNWRETFQIKMKNSHFLGKLYGTEMYMSNSFLDCNSLLCHCLSL